MTDPITNYDGGITTNPARLVTPRNVQELQEILRDAEQYPGPVRAMGSFHSLTPCPATDGTVVRMERIREVIEIDTNAMTVTAEAGIQLGELAKALRKRGFQLILNIEIGNATIGSLACCHSKDAMDGVEHGQVASYVTKIRWVDPTGELQEASEADNLELLELVRSSYGLCGIVYEVTLRIKPVEMVKFGYQIHRSRSLTQAHIADVAATNDAMVCWTIGHTTVVQTRNHADSLERAWLFHLRRLAWTRVGAFVGRNLRRTFRPGKARNAVESVWLSCQVLVYRSLSAIGGFSFYAPDKIMDYRQTPTSARYAFTFWAFPFDKWVENLNEYLEFSDDHYKRHGFRCNMPLGSYFIKRDTSSVLSYTYDGDVLSLDPIHSYRAEDEEEWHRFLQAFTAWAFERGGIPLLTQSPFVTREQVVAAYGDRWQRLSDWIQKVDPAGRMRNQYFDDLLVS